jgi:hypothetical protein
MRLSKPKKKIQAWEDLLVVKRKKILWSHSALVYGVLCARTNCVRVGECIGNGSGDIHQTIWLFVARQLELGGRGIAGKK